MAQKLKRRTGELLELISTSVPSGLIPFIAGPGDLDAVRAFSQEIFRDNALDRAYLRHSLGPGHSLVFGLKMDGRIVACSALEINMVQKRIYITEIGVSESCRGRNLALWMMGRIQQIAAIYGYRHITSHVTLGNTASLNLHKKFGMKPQRVCAEYFHDGQDAYYMHKQVAA